MTLEPQQFCFPQKLLNGDSFLHQGTIVVQTQWSYFALLLRDLKMGCIRDSPTCRHENNKHGIHIQAA
jgi:hypothetical protein